jgi:hypothetical protein
MNRRLSQGGYRSGRGRLSGRLVVLYGVGEAMGTWERKVIGPTAAVVLLAPMLGACSSDTSWTDVKLLPQMDSFTTNTLGYSGLKEEFALAPARPVDLVDASGQCAGAGSGIEPTSVTTSGVALQMTECEIIRRVGTPEQVNVGGNERGERAVVLTYVNGSRPGIYNFTGGRLVSIERGPEPVSAARPQRAAPKAKKRSSNNS